METIHTVHRDLEALRSLLDLWLPYLALPPLIRFSWSWLALAWNFALDQKWGRFWPVLAAILPALIPFARDWDQKAPDPLKGCIVPILLLAVAVLQIYGQTHNNRDRIKTAAERGRDQAKTENRLTDLRDQFIGLYDEIRKGRSEAAEGRKETEETAIALLTQFVSLESEQRAIRDDIGRIADGISALASQVEEEPY
jgi:hypothetical protein